MIDPRERLLRGFDPEQADRIMRLRQRAVADPMYKQENLTPQGFNQVMATRVRDFFTTFVMDRGGQLFPQDNTPGMINQIRGTYTEQSRSLGRMIDDGVLITNSVASINMHPLVEGRGYSQDAVTDEYAQDLQRILADFKRFAGFTGNAPTVEVPGPSGKELIFTHHPTEPFILTVLTGNYEGKAVIDGFTILAKQ